MPYRVVPGHRIALPLLAVIVRFTVYILVSFPTQARSRGMKKDCVTMEGGSPGFSQRCDSNTVIKSYCNKLHTVLYSYQSR